MFVFIRGRPAAFAVSWRVIEQSAKSKHFTLLWLWEKIPAEMYPRTQSHTRKYTRTSLVRLRLFTKATEQQLLLVPLLLHVTGMARGGTPVQGLHAPPVQPPLSLARARARMSQVIISSEGNFARADFPLPAEATPQLPADWLSLSPATIFPHRACPQGKYIFFFVFPSCLGFNSRPSL